MLAQIEINQENVEYLTDNTAKARGDVNFPTLPFDGNRDRQNRVKAVVAFEITTLTHKVSKF